MYDLQNDPYELTNLADKPELQDALIHLRTVLNNWIEETNDLGGIPEKELMSKWLIDGKQPQLKPLKMIDKDGKIAIQSNLKNATILWKQSKDSLWNFYTKPLPSDLSFEVKAERIGYLDSVDKYYLLAN